MADTGGTVERRMIVKGWKIDGYRVAQGYPAIPTEFVSHLSNPHQSSIDFERARIGAAVPDDWQPHITEVIVEERTVTPWEVSEAWDSGVPMPPQSGR